MEQKGKEKEAKLSFVEDIPVTVSVVLGKIRLPLKEVLNIEQNDVILLNKYLDEPVDIYVNDKLFGHGEIVVENNRVGVKILSISEETNGS
jgi:flagellar motor switch protein FliN/FliY